MIRILVVDDNPEVRRSLRGVLEQHQGWRVCDEAGNGEEAVERFREIRPDVIVLDFQMPEMSGLHAARIISRISPETPILMVTLYLSKHYQRRLARLASAARARKRISTVLWTRLEHCCGRRRTFPISIGVPPRASPAARFVLSGDVFP